MFETRNTIILAFIIIIIIIIIIISQFIKWLFMCWMFGT
jgi:hypothetical protein